MIRVLFVCTANVCRSPMAEAIFTHLVDEAGLEMQIEADSAGIADWDIDSAPHPGTMFILEQNGISYEGHGRNFLKADMNDFDYVITMDDENLRAVRKCGRGRAFVGPLMSFVKGSSIHEVPDPYFNNGFEIVYQIIRAGVEALFTDIRRKHAV